ncbi:hypothetical protein GCM10027028_61890 [Streptomyces sundarbansensis]
MRPVDLGSPVGSGGAGEAGGMSMGVVEAMVFPVCVGEPWLPWRRCTGWSGRPGPGGCPAAPGCYEREPMVSRTFALISAGIGA